MICVPITARTKKEALHTIERSCHFADFIELRMDLINGGRLEEFISAARDNSDSVKIIVTCRKKEEAAPAGKAAAKSTARNTKEKMALLKEAIIQDADFVDVELAEGHARIKELQAFCAKQGSKTKIIISYHNLKETPALTKLKQIFHQCAKFKPAIVKIVTTAKIVEDNLTTLNLIPYAKEHSQKIISLCMGDKGSISRVVAPLMGGYLSFAVLEKKGQSAPGQFTVSEMKQINELLKNSQIVPEAKELSAQRSQHQNYILLGNPVGQSLSPLMHNAALKKMGIEGTYSAFCVQDLRGAMQGIRAMNIRGASVTIPYKVAVIEYLDDVDDDALKIGAVNTVINGNGRLTGYNTDWLGLILTLQEVMSIKNKTFVIIGAGGTARAASYGIIKKGGLPVIVNRTPEKGQTLASEFNCAFYSLSAIDKIKADCLINTTPIGMYPKDKSPVKAQVLSNYKYVMDVIYNPLKTRLLKDAEGQGCRIISGLDMFVNQGAHQLRLWTGKEPPRALMKKILSERLTQIE
ncbi:shikimate 5-dehydrogenase i alpha [hydrocarbon metagenome]|uniref:shikimate dehydrogenase (NADP(+)) n=1 Tax=hydrocarbon metagenome TaxID=938273 RepID=A0A0W8FV05_9ZZZZ